MIESAHELKNVATSDRSHRSGPLTRLMLTIPSIMKTCTYCGRENVSESVTCHECGTELASLESSSPLPLDRARSTAASQKMVSGALWFGGGVLVTVITKGLASGGGTYIVAWGAILFGGIRFVQGLMESRAPASNQLRRTYTQPQPAIVGEEVAYEAFNAANVVENQGLTKEALAAYQQVVERFPGTAGCRDAQNSIDSLHRKIGYSVLKRATPTDGSIS
jgi:hypothetical protein